MEKYISKPKYEAILNMLKADTSPRGLLDYALFRFGVTSGLRAAELQGLTWKAIFDHNKTIQVEAEALAACKRAFRARWGRDPKASDYVFNASATGSKAGRCGLTKSTIHLRLKAIISKAKHLNIVDSSFDISTNTLRNTYIRLSIDSGVNILDVCKSISLSGGNDSLPISKTERNILRRAYMEKRITENPQILVERRKYLKEYVKRTNYEVTRRASNPNYRIIGSLRGRIYHAVKGGKKSLHTMELVGCTLEYLKEYLESKFLNGMSWDNYGLRGWHIDHIIPCSSFDLTKIEEQKKCFHYTNLQPLWAIDNFRKGDRMDFYTGGANGIRT